MFKYHLSVEDKEVLRNVCNEAKMKSRESKIEDNQLYDEVFGYLIPTEYTVPGQPARPRIERELQYFSNCTYERFYQWLSNPETQKKIAYHPAVKEKLKRTIEEQKFKNFRLSDKHKGYEAEDEELFRKVLE